MMWISEELKNQGFDVFTAANADAAVTILESHPDICTVFTDVDMPGSMDGLKLAAAVRHRWPPINIVITTGQGPPSGQDMPERSVFIAKPYNSEQVLKAIRSFA